MVFMSCIQIEMLDYEYGTNEFNHMEVDEQLYDIQIRSEFYQ